MLVRFVVSNYLSFAAETEFNMFPGSPRRLKEHIYRFGELELLKSAAIYGANGAGKSNLIKAIKLLRNVVVDGHWHLADYQPFRLKGGADKKDISFEVEFWTNGKIYHYGLVVNRGKIQEEWLYETAASKDAVLIFKRFYQSNKIRIEVNPKYNKTEEDRIRIRLYERELLPENKPLLSMLAEARESFFEVKEVFKWFDYKLVILFPHSQPIGLIDSFTRYPELGSFTNSLLSSLDTGVQKLKVESILVDLFFGEDDKKFAEEIKEKLLEGNTRVEFFQDGRKEKLLAMLENGVPVVKRLKALHFDENGEEVPFDLANESDGTLRLLDLIPAFYYAIHAEVPVIIDEIGQSIHPYLLKKLITSFAKEKTKGQLIFTTHEAHLLDQEIFRQDEIWFAEKKPTGESTFYPLSDFDIRYDLDIRKGYLNGRFQGIPFLANLDDLNWNQYAPEEPSL